MKAYYTLVGFDKACGKFVAIFGDYSKDVVADEMEATKGGEYSKLKIVKTGDTQLDIQAKLDALNNA